jgi:PhzF family phenazine biosynthesis protein
MRIYQVDSFTKVPFAGNPAAVCILEREMPEEWMQNIAAEMNLSETAFLRREAGDDSYSLRWFTPTLEVGLCGHATLASAHVLWTEGIHDPGTQIRFSTKSGELTAGSKDGLIEMVFPRGEVVEIPGYPELTKALGADPVSCNRGTDNEGSLYLFELATPAEVEDLDPDFRAVSNTDAAAVIVTAKNEGGEYDFVSRFFAPGAGIDEDPVTGFAHCSLAPYWAPRLDKGKLAGHQISARSGVVYCEPVDDKVILRGNAVTVFIADGMPE